MTSLKKKSKGKFMWTKETDLQMVQNCFLHSGFWEDIWVASKFYRYLQDCGEHLYIDRLVHTCECFSRHISTWEVEWLCCRVSALPALLPATILPSKVALAMFQISSPVLLFVFKLAYVYVLISLFSYSLGFLKKSFSISRI